MRRLLQRSSVAGFKPLFIRGPAARIFLTDTTPPGAATTVLPADPDLEFPDRGEPLPGEPVAGPLLLVCMHHEHDPCCGREGHALLDALACPTVFGSSHLGGHRFAATAMVLPTGYVYGRLDAAAAEAVLARAAVGEVVTDRCRGRSTWSAEGQIAELAVRAATGLRSPDALVVEGGGVQGRPAEDSGDSVVLAGPAGQRWVVAVDRPEVDMIRPASCGSRPRLAAPLRVGAVRAL